VQYIERLERKKATHRILLRKLVQKRPLRKFRGRRGDNVLPDIREIACDDLGWDSSGSGPLTAP
jgi:hypothetical protein